MASFSKAKRIVVIISAIFAAVFFLTAFNYINIKADAMTAECKTVDYFKEFSLTDVNGDAFTQEDLKNYKIVVVNGWAPWCGPCVGEMPDLEILSQEYKDKGLLIVGTAVDYYQQSQNNSEYIDDVKDAIQNTGVTYPILLSDQAFTEQMVPTLHNSVPGTWAVDSEGNIIEFVSGSRSIDGWRNNFDSWLKGR